MEKAFIYSSLPKSAGDIKVSTDPFETAALTVAVLCNYKNDVNATIEMLNVLKGPSPLSNYEIQFLRDRLVGKEYKPFSYFAGASVDNEYTPAVPYKITVMDNPYSYQEENYAVLYIASSGADAPRQVKLRKKPSTGEWFLLEQFLLSDIRIPASQDPWA